MNKKKSDKSNAQQKRQRDQQSFKDKPTHDLKQKHFPHGEKPLRKQ